MVRDVYIIMPLLISKSRIKKCIFRFFPPYPYHAYNDINNVIFIHIPKCAGTSVLRALGADGVGRLHIDYLQYLRSDPSRYENYVKFSIVRHPVDRLYSCYRYLSHGGNGSPDDEELRHYIMSKATSFDGFVKQVLNSDILSNWDLLRPQHNYICDRLARVKVDLLLRYEYLDEDYNKLRKLAPQLPPSLPHVNKSRTLLNFELSASARHKVEDLYRLDFKLFYPE